MRFPADLFGGSLKTAIDPCSPSTNAIIPLTTIATDGSGAYSSVQAKKSSSERRNRRRYSSGENSCQPTPADKKASTVPYSETKDLTSPASLSDRLTLSLISAGLVCGITPTSIRGASNQPIRVLAFDMPVGADVALQKVACSSLSADANVSTPEASEESTS